MGEVIGEGKKAVSSYGFCTSLYIFMIYWNNVN